jgi:hypothetical protein
VANKAAAPVPKKASNPLPWILLTMMLLAGAGLYYLLNRPAATADVLGLTPEAKAYVKSLKLSEVDMKAHESYLKQRVVEITGKIGNQGERPLEMVEINCVFYVPYGQLVKRERVAIVSKKMGGLKPGETKQFRLPFEDLPASWNQVMPQLVIAGIKFS